MTGKVGTELMNEIKTAGVDATVLMNEVKSAGVGAVLAVAGVASSMNKEFGISDKAKRMDEKVRQTHTVSENSIKQ